MSIRVVSRKLLWGRANNLCAFPGCSQELTVNLDDPESRVLDDAGAVIGEEAHIRSGQTDGPRFDPFYPEAQIDTYGNLILLCPTHHKMVDKEGGRGFSVEDLEEMRRNHESAMSATRSAAEEARRRILERVTASVEVWENKMLLDDWTSLTAGFNSPTPLVEGRIQMAMLDTSIWLLKRDWPAEFPAVREAFHRLGEVLRAINAHVHDSFEWDDAGVWRLERKHKQNPQTPEAYDKLATEFQMGCAMTWCLTIELSKAANLVIRAVREEIEPLYRFDEGVLLAQDGESILDMRVVRLEYEDYQWGNQFRAIDLEQWRALIQAEAEKRQLTRPDHVNPYELLALIENQPFAGSGAD